MVKLEKHFIAFVERIQRKFEKEVIENTIHDQFGKISPKKKQPDFTKTPASDNFRSAQLAHERSSKRMKKSVSKTGSKLGLKERPGALQVYSPQIDVFEQEVSPIAEMRGRMHATSDIKRSKSKLSKVERE